MLTIGLDADDTLWENETFFRVTEAQFCALLSDHGDAETIAASLGISLRSLQRHLRDEGTSLAALKTRARLERAAGLLVRGTLPIKRIAHLAGYRDESSFSRAFRRWSGQSPAEYRRRHAPAAAGA